MVIQFPFKQIPYAAFELEDFTYDITLLNSDIYIYGVEVLCKCDNRRKFRKGIHIFKDFFCFNIYDKDNQDVLYYASKIDTIMNNKWPTTTMANTKEKKVGLEISPSIDLAQFNIDKFFIALCIYYMGTSQNEDNRISYNDISKGI